MLIIFSIYTTQVHADNGPIENLSNIHNPKPRGHAKIESKLNHVINELIREGKTQEGLRVIMKIDDATQQQFETLSSYGVEIETSHMNLYQVIVRPNELLKIADLDFVDFIRTPLQALALESEGVGVMGADDLHALSVTGDGVKVAILDFGFTGYLDLLGTELPPSERVITRSFNIADGLEAHIHGTACAEVVHDVAPDAILYLVNFDTGVEFQNAMTWLIDQDVDVISLSIGWVNAGPYDGTGPICDAVNNARDNGILVSVSAGNQAQKHYQGTYTPNGNDWHDFSLGDEGLTFTAIRGEPIQVFLSWDAEWPTFEDYDLYLYRVLGGSNYQYITSSQTWQSFIPGDPTEAIGILAPSTGTYFLAVKDSDTTSTHDLEIFSFNHIFPYDFVPEGSLMIPADAVGALAMGATYWVDDVIEPYSSQGPTNDGRIKPDLTAPDYVTNSVYGSFGGTSCSAPHAAGAAALLLQEYPVSPDVIQSALEDNAVDLGEAGDDNVYGAGRIDVYQAYLGLNSPPTVSNPSPLTGATNVPITVSSLGFSISDPDSDLMDYTVTTDPDIGSDTVLDVGNGWISIDVSELTYSTTYTWEVSVDDGITAPTTETYSFTTASARLQITPSIGLPGDTITIYGYGYGEGIDVDNITFDNTPLTTVPTVPLTDTLGSWTANFEVPSSSYGNYEVTAVDEDLNTASNDLSIGPVITLSMDNGPAGMIVTVQGRGFNPSGTIENVNIMYSPDTLQCYLVDPGDNGISSEGTFSTDILIPSVTNINEDLEIIVEDDSFLSGSAEFIVTDLPNVSVEPIWAPQGATVTISGTGWSQIASEEVTIWLRSESDVYTEVDTYLTDTSGSFSGDMRIPGITSGIYEVYASQDIWGLDNSQESEEFKVGLIIVILTPEEGYVEDTIRISASGFTEESSYTIIMNTFEVLSGTTDVSGIIDDEFTVPQLDPGTYTVYTVDETAGITIEVDFTVLDLSDLSLIVRGSDEKIYYNVWNDDGSAWSGWVTLPGSTPGRPTAATIGTDLHLVVSGSDGGIYHGVVDMSTDDFSGWSKFPGGTPSAPSLAATSDGLILTVRGNDDNVYYSIYDGSWSSWRNLPGSTPEAAGTTVVGDTYHIMVRGSDSKMYHGQMTVSTETWLGWSLMTGTTPSQPVLCDDGADVYLVVRGSDNGIYSSAYDGTWSSWTKLPGATIQSPGATIYDNELWTCVTGISTGFYYSSTDLDTHVWSGWGYLEGSSPSPPTLIS